MAPAVYTQLSQFFSHPIPSLLNMNVIEIDFTGETLQELEEKRFL
jgi:hypothetical protein